MSYEKSLRDTTIQNFRYDLKNGHLEAFPLGAGNYLKLSRIPTNIRLYWNSKPDKETAFSIDELVRGFIILEQSEDGEYKTFRNIYLWTEGEVNPALDTIMEVEVSGQGQNITALLGNKSGNIDKIQELVSIREPIKLSSDSSIQTIPYTATRKLNSTYIDIDRSLIPFSYLITSGYGDTPIWDMNTGAYNRDWSLTKVCINNKFTAGSTITQKDFGFTFIAKCKIKITAISATESYLIIKQSSSINNTVSSYQQYIGIDNLLEITQVVEPYTWVYISVADNTKPFTLSVELIDDADDSDNSNEYNRALAEIIKATFKVTGSIKKLDETIHKNELKASYLMECYYKAAMGASYEQFIQQNPIGSSVFAQYTISLTPYLTAYYTQYGKGEKFIDDLWIENILTQMVESLDENSSDYKSAKAMLEALPKVSINQSTGTPPQIIPTR